MYFTLLLLQTDKVNIVYEIHGNKDKTCSVNEVVAAYKIDDD